MTHERFTSEEILRHVLDHARDAFIVSDADNRVVLWSEHAETLFGWSAQEALGKPLTQLVVPPEHAAAHERGMKRFLDTGELNILYRRVEVLGMRRDGRRIPLEMMVTPVRIDGRVYFTSSIRDNTERLLRDDKLRQQAALLNLSKDAIFVIDFEGVIEFWNKGAEILFGFREEEAIGQRYNYLLQTAFPISWDTVRQAVRDVGQWEGPLTHATRDGEAVTTLSRYAVQHDVTGVPFRILVSNTDIRVHENLRRSEELRSVERERFRLFYENHDEGVVEFNRHKFLSVNRAFIAMLGMTEQQISKLTGKDLLGSNYPELVIMVDRVFAGEPVVFDTVLIGASGNTVDVNLALFPNMRDGCVVSVHGRIKNISAQKENERRIHFMATHDMLTGLPNRSLIEDRISHAITYSKRVGNLCGILFLDLNRFKVINDSLGHEQGDELLKIVARRLEDSMRESDTVGRLGGDEFAVLLEDVHHQQHIATVARSIRDAIAKPIDLNGVEVSVTTSIGASVYPHDGADVSTLLRHADLAMYESKRHGNGHFRFFDARMNHKAIARLASEGSLRRALRENQFVVHYQPQIDMRSGHLFAVEALLRWKHPMRGLVAPVEFIPLCEELGLINDLGAWVLHEACRQAMSWQREGMNPFKVSVNISAHQLGSGRFEHVLQHVLSTTGLAPQQLELEVTESALMQNIDTSMRTLHAIRNIGVSLSIDDFGTGYSSLSYLKKLPIDTLKIDRSFIEDLDVNPEDAIIVSATLTLAKNLGLATVAEGVTNMRQAVFLAEHECQYAQGFLYSEPMAPECLGDFIRQQ